MDEFDLIERYFRPLSRIGDGVECGIGDDAAILGNASNDHLVVTTDTHVEGVHFPIGADARLIAYRACVTSISDIAAMGATPRWASLSLTIPGIEHDWLAAFADGCTTALALCGASLVGGDTTRGPCAITWNIIGTVPRGLALPRSGAQSNDGIYVSGSLGSAGGALRLGLVGAGEYSGPELELREQYWQPVPRISLGRSLLRLASSCIDISDGLLADLAHIARASGCGAVVEHAKIPTSLALETLVGRDAAKELACVGGDDYELCFTVPLEREAVLLDGIARAKHQVTRIGRVIGGEGVQVLDDGGEVLEFPTRGYRHFT